MSQENKRSLNDSGAATDEKDAAPANPILPYWQWQKASNFKRLTCSWQTCIYNVGICYYPEWDYRYDQSREISKPDIVLQRIEFGFCWWEFSIWFAKRVSR